MSDDSEPLPDDSGPVPPALCSICKREPARAGRKMCATCSVKASDYRRRKQQAGLCNQCGEPRGPGSSKWFCAGCEAGRNAKRRAAYRRINNED